MPAPLTAPYGLSGCTGATVCRQAPVLNLSPVRALIYTQTAYLRAIAHPLLPLLSTVPAAQLLSVSDRREKNKVVGKGKSTTKPHGETP